MTDDDIVETDRTDVGPADNAILASSNSNFDQSAVQFCGAFVVTKYILDDSHTSPSLAVNPPVVVLYDN